MHITRITRHPRESGDPVVALDDEQALHIMRITRHPRERFYGCRQVGLISGAKKSLPDL